MKRNYLYAWIAVAGMTASCSKEVPNNESPASHVINIEASVAPQSRNPQLEANGSGTFTTDDVMTLFISGDNIAIPKDYTYNSTLLTWEDLKLPEGTGQVSFSGCYPQMTVTDGTFEFNTQTAKDKDLLLASAQSVTVGTADPVVLSFDHALHYLELNFTAGTGYSNEDIKNLKVTCNAKTTCVVDAAKGSIKETKETKADYTSTGTTASFYLVPQATNGITLTMEVSGETKKLTLDQLFQQLNNPQTNITGGKRCSLTLKINRSGITVENATIGAWGNQVTTEGEVVIG